MREIFPIQRTLGEIDIADIEIDVRHETIFLSFSLVFSTFTALMSYG